MGPRPELNAEAARIIGALMEKERTVPDTYPLTLKGLVTACNQTSNRAPVVNYDSFSVQRTLDDLKDAGLVRFVHPSHGERTTKFRHVIDEYATKFDQYTTREFLRGVSLLLLAAVGVAFVSRVAKNFQDYFLNVVTQRVGARLYADRIRYVLSTWSFAHGRRITASFGIASLPEDVAPAADEMIRAADEALYAAKRAGKNRVSVHEDVGTTSSGRSGA